MQFLKITESTTLSELSDAVGYRNVDMVLATNGLKRVRQVGKAFSSICTAALSSASAVTWQNKSTILNTLTSDGDVFETAALSDEDDWKLLSAMSTFKNTLKIPESVSLRDSVNVMGGSGVGVSSEIYKKVMDALKTGNHTIPSEIFNDYNTGKPAELSAKKRGAASTQGIYTAYKLPWSQVTLFSSLANTSIDFPVYPEGVTDSRKANYDTMPDTIFQYEPWYTFNSSGPRENSYTFHFHRDMWTGDHTDGKANELIRFCEANCYPEYNGSAVNTSTVTLYIAGTPHISGILTEVDTEWKGPIGQDGWFLECTLTLTITEIAKSPLNFSSVRSLGLIGG